MPSKNIVKEYAPESYYHVYNRGVNKRRIFLDDRDYRVFLSLLKRYLGKEITTDKFGREYKNFERDIELLAFCLMPNHFHLLLYQGSNESSMTDFMRRIVTSYSMYFNQKYKRVGHLFQERFKASRISSDAYLTHISRYIHLNPKDFATYPWSSLDYYLGHYSADWVRPKKIQELFEGDDYYAFVADYKDHKTMLDEIKHELSNL